MKVSAFLLGASLLALPAAAHEVRHVVAASQATVVELSYADGAPFSYEAFEVWIAGAERPFQVGRTDARGRAVFLPPAAGELRLRAFSADGHGVDLRLAPPHAGHPPAVAGGAAAAAAPGRTPGLVLGLGIVLALFGSFQLLLRRKKAS